jgi:integrase
VVRRIFAYAIVTERADRNPAADLAEAVLPVRSEHYAAITDPLEVGHLMLAIQGYKGGAPTRLGLQFLAHTFVRTIEMRSLDKSWIDWPEKVIRYPPGIMKRKRPHIVPMSKQVVRILEEACALDLPGTLVFPGVKGIRSKMSENTINQAIRRLGYSNEEHTGHGFRRTASTTLNESGKFNHDWIERQLAHVEENKIRGAYNAAEYLPQRTAMMQWYSDWLDARAAVADIIG